MYVAVVPNRNSPPAILVRESFRQEGKVRNRTIANLTDWPPQKVAADVVRSYKQLSNVERERFAV